MSKYDLQIGSKYGKWTIISADKNPYYLCQCSCEDKTKRKVAKYALVNGKSTSCGCYHKEVVNPPLDLSLIGKKFNSLTVKEVKLGSIAVCDCICGNTTEVPIRKIKTDKIKSCGCLNTGYISNEHENYCKDFPQEYKSWQHMRERCNNPNFKQYEDYGGRGITVCSRWDYWPYFLKDMGPKPEPKSEYSLDRIDVNGNYEPGNCKWSTYKEQNNNRRPRKYWKKPQ